MKYNSIDYPDERAAREIIVEQPGYAGKNYYLVQYAGQRVNVHCADVPAALFYAARHWHVPFRRPEYHQTAQVAKLGYKPGGIYG